MVCLDSTFLIDFINEYRKCETGNAVKKYHILMENHEQIKTTIINVTELYHGAFYIGTKEAIKYVDEALSKLEILSLSYNSAKRAGSIAGHLQRTGKTVGISDILIASIVLDADETLVTRNVKHFSRIPDLKLESY